MTKRLPMTFFAPPPELWRLALWGALLALPVARGLPKLLGPKPDLGAAAVIVACPLIFIGLAAAAWLERRRRRNPALEISRAGLAFWRGSAREIHLPWNQVAAIWEGGSGLVFQPKDLRKYGRRTLLFVRVGPSVPRRTAATDGTMLVDVIAEIRDRLDPDQGRRARP